MNPRLRDLIQQLGEAIHESVTESEQIAGVVQSIRRHGFDVMLMLEATIGLNELEEKDDKTTTPAGLLGTGEAAGKSAPFSPSDMNFLRSLRITLPPEIPGEDTDTETESGPEEK